MIEFGVDSASDARSIFDQVSREAGEKPLFWFRYLTDGGVGATPITRDEVEWLQRQGVSVGLVYNRIGSFGYTTFVQAEGAAQDSSYLARELAVPPKVAIFADLEYGVPVSTEWLRGWVETISKMGLTPGVYANMVAAYWQRAWKPLDSEYKDRIIRWNADWIGATSSPTAKEVIQQHGESWPKSLDGSLFHIWQVIGRAYHNLVDIDLVDINALNFNAVFWCPKVTLLPPVAVSRLQADANPWRVILDGKGIDAPVLDLEGRLFVEARHVAQALGKTIEVDEHLRTVTIQ
jgi:hypothetical protein